MSFTLEIEPEDFLIGIRLLHSRSPDSSDQLKKLFDLHYMKKFNFNNQDLRKKESIANAFSSLKSLNQTLSSTKNNSETSIKKSKTFDDDSEATDIEDNDTTQDSIQQLQQEFSTNICTVCKQGELLNNLQNRLLECQECKLSYHIDCHKTSILKKDFIDPRSIWYCFKCKNSGKNLKNTTTTTTAMNSGKIILGRQISGSGTISSSSSSSGNNSNQSSSNSSNNFLSKLSSSNDGKSSGSGSLTSGPLKRPLNKISTTTTTGYSVIKSSTLSSSTSSSLNRISGSSSTSGSGSSLTNKTKSSSNLGSGSSGLHSNYLSSSMIGLDKRLANIKKNKSSGKF